LKNLGGFENLRGLPPNIFLEIGIKLIKPHTKCQSMKREIALYTLEGIKDADISTYHFTTKDWTELASI